MRRIMAWGTVAESALVCVLLSGCMVGPDYSRPTVRINQEFSQVDEGTGVESTPGVNIADWWAKLEDPVLLQLTQMAIDDNLTLKQYASRIYQAQAQIGITRSSLLPQFTEDGSYYYQHYKGSNTENWSLDTNMSWELDFFGRLQRLTEAAEADMAQQNELYLQARLILLADIAQTYVNARAYQQQIDIAVKNIEIQKQTYELTVKKETVGMGNRLDSSQALGSFKSVEANLHLLEQAYQQTLNKLSVLTGRAPGAVDELMSKVENIPAVPEQVMVGIPADLLRQRPDVRAAEDALIAQTARIGGAIGELYPMFSLTGQFGLDANSFGNMFDSNSIVAGVGPSFRWNILNFGRYRSNVQLQEFAQQELVNAYKQSILVAAQEVDDSLVGYVKEKERLATLTEAVSAWSEALKISQQRYMGGTADFQRVLDSQTALLTYELQQVQCQANLTNYVVALYKALGGGN